MVKKNSYSDLIHKFHDYIIIQKAGFFYDVRDFGAIFFSNKLGYSLYSDKASEYKIGIPLKSIKTALNILKEANYKYIITEHYEIVEQYDNGKSTPTIDSEMESLKEKNVNDNYIEYNKKDKQQIYNEYISQIRNYILKQNKWIEIIEIEKFFGLKRRGKFIKDDNLSTVAHLINRFLKKEGFKTKRVNLEYDYSIWVAPSHVRDLDLDSQIYNEFEVIKETKTEENTQFYSTLNKKDAQEILDLNNSNEYSYTEKLMYCKNKFDLTGEEHTNFQCIGKFGSLNQYILEAYCVLNNFTTRRWISAKKISEEDLLKDTNPVKYSIITEKDKEIHYELFNLSQTIEYQEIDKISQTTQNKLNKIPFKTMSEGFNFLYKAINAINSQKVSSKDIERFANIPPNSILVSNEALSLPLKNLMYLFAQKNSGFTYQKNTMDAFIIDNNHDSSINSSIEEKKSLTKKELIDTKEVKKSYENLEDYNKIIKLINQGKNIFVTGNAGTGKSFILNKLKKKYKKRLELTSTTGLAAVNIKGVTIHSWAGVGICKKSLEKCVKDILGKKSLVNKIRKCKLLAIDEISMLKGDTFTYIDQVLRMVREDDSPFGGIQLLLFGDFYQLPPVETGGIDKNFCFETNSWKELNLVTIKLEKIYRQSEASFIKALNNIRQNKIDEEDFKLLKSREIDYATIESSMLHIFSRNDEANNYNKQKFDAIDSKVYTYKANIGIYRGEKYIEKDLTDRELMIVDVFQKNCKAFTELFLKKGCRVMLMINLDFEKGLINGSCGEIINLDDTSITVKFDNGIVEDVKVHKFEYYYNDILTASMTQFPLRLAYAITIHKSQGMTLENVVVDCNKIFEEGQTYVALSRVKNLNGLYLRGFSLDKIKVNSKVVEFYKNLT